jgi:hypothetical protein
MAMAAMALRRVSLSIRNPIRPFVNHLVPFLLHFIYINLHHSFPSLFLPAISLTFYFHCLIRFSLSNFLFLFQSQSSLPNEAVQEKEKARATVSHFAFSRFGMIHDWKRLFHSGSVSVSFMLRNYLLQWIKQLNEPLEVIDPDITDIIELEKARQWKVHSYIKPNSSTFSCSF